MALNLAVALVLGLVGGVGVALVIENLDARLYTARHIEEVVDQSIVAAIPAASASRRSALFDVNSPQHEALRRVRTHLLTANGGAPPHTMLVTSAEPEEGKSTVVANLAAVIAQAGLTVAVVDGDLRVPALHRIFGLPNEIGLSSVLRREATWDQVIQASHVPGVDVITSGPTPPNAAELLGSCEMAALIEQLVRQVDVVLLDAPALLTVADALVLAQAVEGVLLVVGRAQARAEAVRAARDQVINARVKSVGVVINRAEQDTSYGHYRRAAARA
jgi:polysaccharide biosynthesis transport protein